MIVSLADTVRLYDLLDRREAHVGGTRVLVQCNERMNWSRRGIDFFFETGECRTGSGTGCRFVRIGTHAVNLGSRTPQENSNLTSPLGRPTAKFSRGRKLIQSRFKPLGENHDRNIYQRLLESVFS